VAQSRGLTTHRAAPANAAGVTIRILDAGCSHRIEDGVVFIEEPQGCWPDDLAGSSIKGPAKLTRLHAAR